MKVDALLLLAVEASLVAGRAILKIYSDGNTGVTWKSDQSPLTEADRLSDELITSVLGPTGIPVLSEESAQAPYPTRKDWKRCWIVDPLDGTREFIGRNGDFTVNIALVEQGKPIAGVVFAPVTGELYFGSAGSGSWKVLVQEPFTGNLPVEEIMQSAISLPVMKRSERPFTIVGSRSHRNPETDDYIRELEKREGEVVVVSRGSSLKICLVAEGVADIYPRFGPTMEWDTAAGHAIAIFAGYRIFDVRKEEELSYNKENLLNPWFIVQK